MASADPSGARITPAVRSIEDAFEHHWRLFGLYPGASLYDQGGVLWYESPIAHLPYNAVIRSHIPSKRAAEPVVSDIVRHFHERSAPFMWVVRPSDTPHELASLLARAGLDLVEEATGMELRLDVWRPDPVPSSVEIIEAAEGQAMHDYEALIRTYWSVPDSDRAMIQTLNRHWTGSRSPGVRLVGYLDGKPVSKLFLSLVDLPERCAVYGVSVLPEARGHGIAWALMTEALRRGQEAGAEAAVLHSSRMALSMYRKMGFAEHCTLAVFATEAIFGTHHH